MKFLWRYVSWVFSLPLLLAAICFAVGNREPTIINLPLDYVMTVQIYQLALLPLGIGLLSGAGMQWFVGLRYRLAAQKLGKEIAQLKAENLKLKDKLATSAATPSTPDNPAERTRFRLIAGQRPKA
jgi:hypothetical protein